MRATGKTHYVVEDDSFGRRRGWRVLRVNVIGQGWGVATYTDEETAKEVAAFLTSRADREAS